MKDVKIVSRRSAFTLIELLVVVAIIGLLASVVIASLSSARTKAAYAAAKQLDANFGHNLGDSLVGQWYLDDGLPNCSGTVTGTLQDTSGYNNHGTGPGGGNTPSWSTDTPFGTGCSMGTAGGDGFSAPLPNVNLSDFTISFWMKPNTQQLSAVRAIIATPAFQINIGVDSILRLRWTDATQSDGPTVILSKWQYVVVTRQGSNVRYYYNGSPRGTGTAAMSGTVASIGVGYDMLSGIGGNFYGNIDNVRIYDRALDTSEIQKLYAMDAAKHGMAFVGNYSPFTR